MGDVDYALLRDVPMASGTLQYLDSNESTWTVYDSLNRWTLPGMVPGDLISDLQAANIIPDPNFGLYISGVLAMGRLLLDVPDAVHAFTCDGCVSVFWYE